MSSDDDKDAKFQAYEDDSRVPCQYGVKCYQKNPQHHSKYKHPPKKGTEGEKTEKVITGEKRKRPIKGDKETSLNPQKKLQKKHKASERKLHNLSLSPKKTDVVKDNKDDDKKLNEKGEALNQELELSGCISRLIMDLFLVEMPDDFFLFYKLCKHISKDDPLSAFKIAHLKLVGPYDVLDGKIKISSSKDDKDKYLTHWRYYYDPPEFQTVVKCDDKEGLHFGYWRDNATEKPVFVAQNRATVNGIFEPVAENIFGAVDAYLQTKLKSCSPFDQFSVMRLRSQLKHFSKQQGITLEKNTATMRAREKQVVARTFHKAGIVVPYDKKTKLGYRDLAATDNDLQKILKQIEEADTLEERKTPIVKLDEIVRWATIAADECDFGTCLELGHDLFSNGSIHVQTRALQMLSIAYTHLKRPQLLKILEAHLKNRKKDCELSVI